MEERLGTSDLPRTHSRGSKAIDHVWATKYILDNIQHAGFAPFGHFYDSDHRGIFIDIEEKILFQEHESKIIYHEYRRLKSCTPKRVKKYMKKLKQEWDVHKIDKKYENILSTKFTDPLLFEKALNNLDKQITEIMINAEKSCTNMSSHHLDSWSPELVEAYKKKRYWKSQVTVTSKMPHYSSLVESIMKFRDALDKYKEAEDEYNELSEKSEEVRTAFLKERAKEAANEKGTEAEKEIKSLIETEKSRSQNRRIKKVVKKQGNGGPSSIY